LFCKQPQLFGLLSAFRIWLNCKKASAKNCGKSAQDVLCFLYKGLEQGLEEAARRMLKKGRSAETSIEDIGLTKEQADSLR
jgi:hypothetical protein